MSVKRDEAAGTRYVQIDFEVPGSPEEVWRAIATGPGISAWFVPTEVTEREGGEIAFEFGPEMGSSKGVVTGWEPPRRFAYEEREWMPGAPPVATELVVEARSGGTCVVRMVHSLFTDSDEWDDQLESFENGWPPFLRVLDGYLRHFAGERCSHVRAMAKMPGSAEDAWKALTGALGIGTPAEGERLEASAPGAPALAGVVENVTSRDQHRNVLIRTDAPAPGYAIVGAFAWADSAHADVALYLYGDAGAAVAGREQEAWREWTGERFPRQES